LALKKKAAKRTKRRVRRPPQGAVILVPKVVFETRTVIASDEGCLDADDARALVESCLPAIPHNRDTALGELFQGDSDARGAFCACVQAKADSAGCTRRFPSSDATTLGQIADALTC
jgi:hypothetical protein